MRLRVPINDGVANAASSTIPKNGVQVFIPAALNRPTHTLYSICVAVQPTLQEWTVNRRYSQFLTLRSDIVNVLSSRKQNPCPGCLSFCLALRQFAFPKKTWMRTSRVVRKRVKALEAFLQLIAERLFNDLPKCHVCGEQVKRMMRPFLIRGAQPLGDSNLTKIQHSLSLQSYAILKHKPRRLPKELDESEDSKKVSPSVSGISYATTERTDSDPAISNPDSPTSTELPISTISEESYGKQFGDERCTDTPVDLKEALKQVVLADKRRGTVEEVAFRLTTMWDAYALDDTMAAVPKLQVRLSQSQGSSEDDMVVYEDDDDDEVLMLERETNENNSLALLQDNYVYDEEDDDDRVIPPGLAVDEVAF